MFTTDPLPLHLLILNAVGVIRDVPGTVIYM